MNNTKTPVMILQELMVKHNITPQYELMQNTGTSHEPEFHYIVFAGRVSATGEGRSKKDAKHEAALKALEKYEKIVILLGWYVPDKTSRSTESSRYRSDSPGSPVKVLVNHVGALKDFCAEKKLPEPQAILISDVGPAHAREFTVQYVVGSIKYSATAPTKKLAKQSAARKILQCLMDTLVDAGNVDIVPFEEFEKLDNEMREKISQIKNKNPDKSRILSQFHKSFQISDKDVFSQVASELQSSHNPEIIIDNILKILDCEKNIDTVIHTNANKHMIILTITTDPLLTFHGSGYSIEEAVEEAYKSAVESLKLFML